MGQTESLGLEEMLVRPASPFVAEMFLVRRKKKKNQCLFLSEKIALCALLVFSYY